jgi:signal transduction histidine kinase
MLGYSSAAEALNRLDETPFRSLADRAALNAQLRREQSLTRVESCLSRADGHLIWVLEDASLVRGEPGNAPLVERMFTDITERHRLYEEIRRSRRIEALGRLNVATAQDFTSLLTSIAGYVDQLLKNIGSRDPLRRQAESLRDATGRASGLARKLAECAEREIQMAEVVDLNDLLKSDEMLIGQLIGEDIEFAVKPWRSVALVAAAREEIEQILTTLLVNVRNSMPVGGTVTVEIADGDEIDQVHFTSPCLAVKVTGTGYGVQPVHTTPALESAAAGIGAHLQVRTEPGTAGYRMCLPRSEGNSARRIGADMSGVRGAGDAGD